MKRCVYCSIDLADSNILDFCESCGKCAFGDKMFDAIKKNMFEASQRGDLDQTGFWINDKKPL